jgi:hypothetical protein
MIESGGMASASLSIFHKPSFSFDIYFTLGKLTAQEIFTDNAF